MEKVSTVDKLFGTMESAETGLRLLKVGQYWSQIGFKIFGNTGFYNCEKWLGKVTICQALLRLVKATKLFYNTKHPSKRRSFIRRESTAQVRGSMEFTLDQEKRGLEVDKLPEHQSKDWGDTISYVSSLTLAVVSTTSIINFLGKEKIIIFSDGFKTRLNLFCTYGGGVWGNGVAAFASWRGAYMASQKRIDPNANHKAAEKQEQIDNSSMGFAKYMLDLIAALMGVQGINPRAILIVKGFSNHLAVVQSFRAVTPIPGWQTVTVWMGLSGSTPD